jgi:hypothetical protein
MISLNAEHRESLVKRAGGVLSAAEVGSLLQITHLVVDERRTTGAAGAPGSSTSGDPVADGYRA